ncbi:receptor-interacting serine/threonine-protein kinase 3 isoform X1 [Centroberyx affinis]|uniref:receptor-interacting serine/threonine-protein kinase 3 isoform X1 n=1 Tax=Centroberyx affinis TaxID=166261 RepID=UPI003A5C669C
MALSSCSAPVLIGDSSLQSWEVIGSGGFGQIYKARHCQWACDVAVKLLHYDDGSSSSLLREVDLMRQGSSPFILQVLGVFQGRLPSSGMSSQLGLVMEFMERGSLASLQDSLRGPPPWPLAFRLAHQVALGINFLHSLSPPLLHLDLKPNNVLLDYSLNAKLTDFGLARYYHSVTRQSKKDSTDEAGTISYMPPEAFKISYRPTRASDIYSYGILLWSIVTGKQPYAHAISSIVRLRIPQGDRPSLAEINHGQAAGLRILVELMERCWVPVPTQRPSSLDCTAKTEDLFKMHKHAINNAVHQVLAKLDQTEGEQRITEGVTKLHVTQPLASPRVEAVKALNNVLTGPSPVQEMAGGLTPNQRDKASGKGQTSPRPTSASYAKPVHSATNQRLKTSPVLNNRASPSPPLPRRPHTDGTPKPFPSPFGQYYQRQFSSPDTFSNSPRPAGVSIYMSNVTGLQIGDNNDMYIHTTDLWERKRHPTAPPSVNLSPPHPGRHKDKTGTVG